MIHDEIIIHHHHHVMFYELICNKNNYFYRKKAASVPRQKFGMTKSCNTSYVRYLVLFNDTSSLVSLSFLSDKAFENFHTSESTNLTYSNIFQHAKHLSKRKSQNYISRHCCSYLLYKTNFN